MSWTPIDVVVIGALLSHRGVLEGARRSFGRRRRRP